MRLLALDIDDTTLCRDGTLSEKNMRAIKSVVDRGDAAVIVTGRSPMATKPIWERMPVSDICVCFGGAAVVNMRTGEILSATYIEPETLRYALRLIHRLGLTSQIYRGDDIITEHENEYSSRYIKYLRLADCIIQPNMHEMLHENITKLLCFSPPEKLNENMRIISDELGDKMGISSSGRSFIELNNPNADKGAGLEKMCEILNVDIRDTVAIGDSLLDLPMILKAGVGVAVQNAYDEVLNCADVVAPDCDKDAVAWTVERYFA